MVLYGLKNCDACRKALRALPHAQLLDVREDPVPADILVAAEKAFGDALVNRRSTTWRTLSEEARAGAAQALLAAHPTLMKRPLIVDGEKMTLGWSAETEAAWR